MNDTTKAERETVVRISRHEGTILAWTDEPETAAAWRKAKWPVTVAGTDMRTGKDHSWSVAGVPVDRVVFLKMGKK